MPSGSDFGAILWTEADLRPVGFFATRPERYDQHGIEIVCSPSECFADWPAGWMERWRHNRLFLYDDLPTLRAIVPDPDRAEFLICAVASLPVQFGGAEQSPTELATVAAERPPSSFVRLGFDVCCRSNDAAFECSPLSCNLMAAELPANRYGLFDRFEDAMAATSTFDAARCEPGPYAVLEIRAERDPLAD